MNVSNEDYCDQEPALPSNVELRHLRYFVAVAEELSFTKGAKKLRLAQPSLTRQVRNLENDIGVRLLDRAHNRVALTEEGRVFLLDVKRLLAKCADSIAAVQRMRRGGSSQINVAYLADAPLGILPIALGTFRRLFPRVTLNLFDMRSVEQLQALGSREIDLGFVGLYPAFAGEDLVSECVSHDTIVVALSECHPFAKMPDIKLAGLASEFFAAHSEMTHPGARDWLLDTCQDAGFAAKILQEVRSDAATIRFVAHGLGVALMPEHATRRPHEGVVFRPLSPPLRRESVITWRADNRSDHLQDFIQIVKGLSRSTQISTESSDPRSRRHNAQAPQESAFHSRETATAARRGSRRDANVSSLALAS